jgi:hypothetical protein
VGERVGATNVSTVVAVLVDIAKSLF